LVTNNSYPEIQDTTDKMNPGDLVKFVGYYEDWHVDPDVWKYGVLIEREGTNFSILWNSGIHKFAAEHWYIKKV